MRILARYVHGSGDSLDLDTCYLVDQLPSDQACKEFCEAHSDNNENANMAEMKDGVLSAVYKGTIDEFNNSLRATYALHQQSDSMLLKRDLKRDEFLKIVRVIRCILSYFSRTHLRADIKKALRSSSLQEKLDVLKMIDLTQPVNFGNKADLPENAYKAIAFQLGQVLGLVYSKIELYTKSDISNFYPALKKYLYREKFDFEWESQHVFSIPNSPHKEDQYRNVCTYYTQLEQDNHSLQSFLNVFICVLTFMIDKDIRYIAEGIYTYKGKYYHLLTEKVHNVNKYVLGIAFNESRDSVVLLQKNRPSFLAGKWNGVGGHIEANETSLIAMQREFKEETDIDTDVTQWVCFHQEQHATYEITWYSAKLTAQQLNQLKTMTDEPVALFKVADLSAMSDSITTDVLEAIELTQNMSYY